MAKPIDFLSTRKVRHRTLIALVSLFAGAAVVSLQAQSAEALINKLVDKGILTMEEAQELRKEAAQDYSEAFRKETGMPDWVTDFNFSGDLRARYEMQSGDQDDFTDRHRFRYRLRFGAVATLKDDFEVGLRLASGADEDGLGSSPISRNATLRNNGSGKYLFIDRAYASWSPLKENLTGTFTVGKMANPFEFSQLVFDSDYAPEGLGTQFGYELNQQHFLALNAGAFVLDELSGSSADPYLFGAQARWDASWSEQWKTSLGAGILTITEEDSLVNTAVPNVNQGNTRNAAGAPVADFHPFVVDGSLTYNCPNLPFYGKNPFPVSLLGEYFHNPGADSDNNGYAAGIQFGNAKKKGQWDISYRWQHLEADAWYEELTHSDFSAYYSVAQPNSGQGTGGGSGTNVQGHIVSVRYMPFQPLTLAVTYFRTELINEFPAGSDSELNRLQVDASWRF